MVSPSLSGSGKSARSLDTIVVGGGQAGLACGYFLKQHSVDFIILDESLRAGSSWSARWDSLRLFTPSQFDGLPGYSFPKASNYFPYKDEMADYLENYEKRFDLPVEHGLKVDRLERKGAAYEIAAGPMAFTAPNVIVATGPYRLPRIPAFAAELDGAITQLHSSAYCNPAQVGADSILVVGAANSGAEIALELAAAGKDVWLAGRDVGVLPVTGRLALTFGARAVWGLMHRILNVSTPMGRKARIRMLTKGHPLGRARRQELKAAKVKLVGRVTGIDSGKPRLEDGRLLQTGCVIWATGFRPDYAWIKLPIFDERGYPRHARGVIVDQPGLYFVGLPFQSAFDSAIIGGVGADAAYIVRRITN